MEMHLKIGLYQNGSVNQLYNTIIGQHMADKGKIIINKDISEIPILQNQNGLRIS